MRHNDTMLISSADAMIWLIKEEIARLVTNVSRVISVLQYDMHHIVSKTRRQGLISRVSPWSFALSEIAVLSICRRLDSPPPIDRFNDQVIHNL